MMILLWITGIYIGGLLFTLFWLLPVVAAGSKADDMIEQMMKRMWRDE